MQIDFWDVGQGDCTVITLPNGKLILIDVGRAGSPVVDWLNQRRRAPEIFGIILTHNHADHVGALCPIVAEHKRRIENIWMLADRSRENMRELAAFRCADEAANAGYFSLTGIRAGDVLWEDTNTGTRLKVVHPSFSENIYATNPNSTSSLIVLESADTTLIAWPGDLGIQRVATKVGNTSPWILHGPHHGAPSDYKDRPGATDAISAISPKRSFISVGTANSYHHPRPRYVRLLARTGCHAVCSQLTFRCEREKVRNNDHVFDGSGALGLRAARSGVTCRGSWRVFLKDGRLIPDAFDLIHLERVAQLKRPQCLLGRGWRRGKDIPAPVE